MIAAAQPWWVEVVQTYLLLVLVLGVLVALGFAWGWCRYRALHGQTLALLERMVGDRLGEKVSITVIQQLSEEADEKA